MVLNQFVSSSVIARAVPAVCLALLMTGCTGKTDPAPATSKTGAPTATHAEHDHAHPKEGPHHGTLVELGSDEYHAEIVHGKDGAVTVYLLDGAAKAAVPIDAEDVTINLTHEGKAEQFKLAAAREESDPEGKSSRFTSSDEHLGKDLDAKGSSAKLVVTINGKQYSGKISHDHGHDHGHDHSDHKH